jgi:hypothetical protein
MKTINVAKDFTRFPSGRFKRNGSTSGEAFRQDFLEPPLRDGQEISVELDGTIGYGSSFLEEAFGGLIRSLGLSPLALNSKLKLMSEDPSLLEEISGYIEDAGKKKK